MANSIQYPSFHFIKLQGRTKGPPLTSKHKRPNLRMWSTSRKTKYPQDEHGEFGFV
ncbi:hypothetical protein ACS0TY_027917 [Phlomoides rotata]